MDLNDFEALVVNTLGNADNVTIGDLAGTGLTDVTLDLANSSGSDFSDGVADAVQVEGTAGVDTITATANGGAVDVAGLAASVRILHTDPGLDRLTFDTLAGADNVSVDAAVNAPDPGHRPVGLCFARIGGVVAGTPPIRRLDSGWTFEPLEGLRCRGKDRRTRHTGRRSASAVRTLAFIVARPRPASARTCPGQA